MKKLYRYSPLLVFLLPAFLFINRVAAGPYPGGLRDHGHTGPGDGGNLVNPHFVGVQTITVKGSTGGVTQAQGSVGYSTVVVSGNLSFGSQDTWVDVAASTLPPGNYLISGCASIDMSTFKASRFLVALKNVPGNSSAGSVAGFNLFEVGIGAIAVQAGFCFNDRYVAVTSTQAWYIKAIADYNGSGPQLNGYFEAIQIP